MTQRIQTLGIHGMHCAGCEMAIENAVKQLPGVNAVSADYAGDRVTVCYDDTCISIETIIVCVDSLGYYASLPTPPSCLNTTAESAHSTGWRGILQKAALATLALTGIGFILWLDSWFTTHVDVPDLGRDMSYGLLIIIGFLTSFHCVGMCGPLILSYTAKSATNEHTFYGIHLLYGIGKTISYTFIGALFGAFGSIIAFTPFTQGAVGVAAGIFLILFGLHMLEVFPALNHFQFRIPTVVMRFISREYRKHSNPFIIGLLNGLMIICGPLQAMYVMAASTGSWTGGAMILFFFGIGTLPLLLGFGFLTSLISANLTPKILKASGLIVMILGVIMLNRGLAVTGTGVDFNTLVTRVSQKLSPIMVETPSHDATQTIHMDVLSSGFSPNKFTLRKGRLVQWVINGKELNECNNVIVVPRYKLRIALQSGIQIIKFTPLETGVVSWSCQMGMMTGAFIVVDNEAVPTNAAKLTEIVEHLFQALQHLWHRLEALYQGVLATH
jgi:uncharacterized protein